MSAKTVDAELMRAPPAPPRGVNARFQSKLARVESFVDLHVLEPPRNGKDEPIRCRCFELIRVSVDGRQGAAVARFEIRKDVNVQTVATQILDRAQDIANEMQDAVTFDLKVYHGQEQIETASLPMKLVGEKRLGNGSFDPIGLGEMTEPATAQGERSQLMRHREAEQALQLRGFSTNMDVSIRMNDRMSERYERLLDRYDALQTRMDEMIAERQRMLDDNARREAERIQLINAERRKDEFLKSAQVLIPVIVNRLAGQKILPEGSVSAFKEMAKNFVNSIDAQSGQYDALMAALNPAQRVALMEIMATIFDEEQQAKQKEEEERKKIAALSNDPRELAKVVTPPQLTK